MDRRRFLQLLTGGVAVAALGPVADWISEPVERISFSNEMHDELYNASGVFEIYVRPGEGSDSNPGTESRPLNSLSEAIDRIPVELDRQIIMHIGGHEDDKTRRYTGNS